MCACVCGNKEAKPSELDKILARHKGERGSLIPVLQEVQEVQGYISQDAIREISAALKIPATDIFGVATFYAQFHLSRAGAMWCVFARYSLSRAGSAKILAEVEKELGIQPGETTEDLRYTLEPVACLGLVV